MSTRPVALFALGLSIAAFADCGRKSPLELPPGRAPLPVERLTAVAEAGAVRLAWTNPVKTVAGKPLGPVGAVEIWVFEKGPPAAGASLPRQAVETTARLAARLGAAEAAAASYLFAPVPDKAKGLGFTVRVLDRKGRLSEFSPVAVLAEREGP